MELRRYGMIFLAWWWLLVAVTALAGVASYAVSRSMPKTYRASVTLLVNQAQSASGLDYNSLLMSERLSQTYAELIKKPPVLSATIEKLGLGLDQEGLGKLVTATVVRNTQLLQVSVENESPALARDIANTMAEVFAAQRLADQSVQSSSSRAALQKQIDGLEQEMRATTAALDKAKATTGTEAEVTRLQSQLSQQQVTYSQLARNETDMALAEARASNSLKVVVPAELPMKPVRPNVLQNTLLAAVVGLLLAVGAVFLIEYLDDTVKSETDVQAATELSTLAVIPRIRRRKDEKGPKLLDAASSRSSLGEAYRMLRTNVDFAWAGQPGQVILFTSANPSEGKSTTVANLALVLAEDKRRVVLVDADLRRPSQHRAFGVSSDRGLSNLLADPRARAADYLLATESPSLRLLASGPIPPNPSELLGSPRFGEVMAELKELADVVLVDAPPVLGVVDPAVIAGRVDGVILVAEAGGTRLEALARTAEVVARGAGRRLGVVLNKVGERSADYRYYYYHRKGYYQDSPKSGEGVAYREAASSNGVARDGALTLSGRI